MNVFINSGIEGSDTNKVLSLFKEKFLLFFIGAFANFPVHFIGVLKLSEIICLIYAILNSAKIITLIITNKYIKYYTFFLLIWLILGTISSFVNNGTQIGIFKGISNIFFIYITFLTFYLLLRKNLNLVTYFLIPYGLGSIIFSPFSYSLDSQLNILGDKEFDSFDNYFDVFIAPILNPLVVAAALFFYNNKYLQVFITFGYGLIAIIYDAKSVGFVFLLASISFLARVVGVRLSLMKIRLLLIVSPIIMLSLLFFLSEKNLLGRKSSEGIVESLDKSEKFNPFLIIGRPDPVIGLLAVIENPLLGHGFNKQDTKYTQLAIALGLLPFDYSYRYEGIPSHSCLIYSMIEGGLIAGFLWLYILSLALKSYSIMFRSPLTKFSILVNISMFYLLWNVLFSGIQRIDIAFFLVFVILYISSYQGNRSKLKFVSHA